MCIEKIQLFRLYFRRKFRIPSVSSFQKRFFLAALLFSLTCSAPFFNFRRNFAAARLGRETRTRRLSTSAKLLRELVSRQRLPRRSRDCSPPKLNQLGDSDIFFCRVIWQRREWRWRLGLSQGLCTAVICDYDTAPHGPIRRHSTVYQRNNYESAYKDTDQIDSTSVPSMI